MDLQVLIKNQSLVIQKQVTADLPVKYLRLLMCNLIFQLNKRSGKKGRKEISMIKEMTESGVEMVMDTVEVLVNAAGKMISSCFKKSECKKAEETHVKNTADESMEK